MSDNEYMKSIEIGMKEYPFNALIMAVMRKGNPVDMAKLKQGWPDVYKEFMDRCRDRYGEEEQINNEG